MAEAVGYLSYGEAHGELAAESILDPEGKPAFATDEELRDALFAYEEGANHA